MVQSQEKTPLAGEDGGATMPLVQALMGAIAPGRAPFHTPGHRGGRGMAAAVRSLSRVNTGHSGNLPVAWPLTLMI